MNSMNRYYVSALAIVMNNLNLQGRFVLACAPRLNMLTIYWMGESGRERSDDLLDYLHDIESIQWNLVSSDEDTDNIIGYTDAKYAIRINNVEKCNRE